MTTTGRTPTNPDEDDIPHGVDPTLAYMMRHLQARDTAVSSERKEQTVQFTGALDKLGGRFEAKMDTNTGAMVGAARLAAGVVVLTLLILGSIAGAVTYFKGGEFEAGSSPSSAPPR